LVDFFCFGFVCGKGTPCPIRIITWGDPNVNPMITICYIPGPYVTIRDDHRIILDLVSIPVRITIDVVSIVTSGV